MPAFEIGFLVDDHQHACNRKNDHGRMKLRCNHNYRKQSQDECGKAAREELLETAWGIRGDECADLPIAVAKKCPS